MSSFNVSEIEHPPIYNFYLKQAFHGYMLAIFCGALISILVKLINIPHQIPAALFGIIIGLIARQIGYFEDLVMDAHILQSVYTPLLVAKMVYNMDHYLFNKSLLQIFIIAVIGNLAFVFIFGMLLFLFQTEVSIPIVMMISAIIAPNDNAELPVPDGIKNLETLMYGETILGVGVCNIARIIFIGVLRMYFTEWYHVVAQIIRYIGFSIPIGFGCGWTMALLYRQLYNDSMNAVAAYLSTSYFVYIMCERIARSSGILGSFITLYIMTTQRSKFLTKTDHDIKMCCDVAFTLVHCLLIIFCVADSIYSLSVDDFMIKTLESMAIYTMGNVIRLLIFLLASPLLSRCGYGFKFASLVTIFWAVQKGPVQLIQVFKMHDKHENLKINDYLNFYVLGYVILTCFINGSTLKIILKAFGLIKLSNRRKANISIAINFLNEIGTKVLSALKSNQYYSDVNWSVINTHTVLKNPFEDFGILWTKDNVICHVCNTAVPLKPTRDEYNEHLKDVTLRTLKAQRVSFLEQHERGLLSKEDVELLLRAIDIAMDSTNMNINLDSLLSCMDSKKAFVLTSRERKLLTIDSSIKIPKTRHRKKCYCITISLTFEVIMTLIVLFDLVVQIVRLKYHTKWSGHILYSIASLCYISYFVEAVLRILSYANGSLYLDLKHYISNHWNKIDIFVILIATVDIVSGIIYLTNRDVNLYIVFNYMRWVKLAICIKLLRLFTKIYPLYIGKMERRKELKLMRAFAVAQSIVISCEEVIGMLPTLTEQSNIREVIKINLEHMRTSITQKMGLLEKSRPSLTTTVKTRQALRCILKHLNQGIRELLSSGLIDVFEYQKLYQSISFKNTFLTHVRILEDIQPTLIFKEIPWLYGNEELMNYIYKNVKNKIFNAGDILCQPGDIPEGVYIIVAGFFKVTYYPTPELLAYLKQDGVLPTKEFLEYMRFDEVHEEYLSCGNRMGELAILTNRPYHCLIVSEAPSQVFIIPRQILENAKDISADPVLGLSAKIWKCVLFGLSRRLLLTTIAYQSATKHEAEYALNRAVVPNIDYYSVINISEFAEDVLVLEGIVIDFNTREIYTAPCPLPSIGCIKITVEYFRHVKKLIMPKSHLKMENIITKLVFIPDNNTDEYEMMLTIQKNSELVTSNITDNGTPNHPSTMLSENMNNKRHFESHMFSLSKPKLGTLAFCHKIMSFNGGVLYYANEDE